MVCPFCNVDASGHLAFTEHRIKDWILLEDLVFIAVSVGIDVLPSIGRRKRNSCWRYAESISIIIVETLNLSIQLAA